MSNMNCTMSNTRGQGGKAFLTKTELNHDWYRGGRQVQSYGRTCWKRSKQMWVAEFAALKQGLVAQVPP